jgi:Mn-containing catalase
MNQMSDKDQLIHEAVTSPLFMVLSGGGPGMVNSAGQYWTGAYINANGDPTVDLRSNIAAESRAKIVYEYLKQFTDDPAVQDTLSFLMTREVAHFQQFTAALNTLPANFPPGKLPGDARFTNLTFNLSDGNDLRGPWNQGQGPWPQGVEWDHVSDPKAWLADERRLNKGAETNPDGKPQVKGVTFFSHMEHVPSMAGGGGGQTGRLGQSIQTAQVTQTGQTGQVGGPGEITIEPEV